MTARIRILIGLSPGLLRALVEERLGLDPDAVVVGAAADAPALLELLARTPADVVLVDLGLPGGGAAAVLAATGTGSVRVLVLVLDGRAAVPAFLDVFARGAVGYLSSADGEADLVRGVLEVGRGNTCVPPLLLGPLLAELIARRRTDPVPPQAGAAAGTVPPLEALTVREREVLQALADGAELPHVAAALGLSVLTVRTHLQRLMRKLGVHTRQDAVAWLRDLALAAQPAGR